MLPQIVKEVVPEVTAFKNELQLHPRYDVKIPDSGSGNTIKRTQLARDAWQEHARRTHAACFKTSALSTASQLNSGSARPKCP